MRVRLFALCALVAVFACDRAPVAPTTESVASGPSPVAAGPVESGRTTAAASAPGRENVLVNILDACDPESFDAVVGPGTCVRNGGMKFDRFTTLLQQLGFVAPWRFTPDTAKVAVGQTFVATNMGGEVHTFTEVAAFGGGIVPVLNQLGGFGATAPECSALEEDDFVAPGANYTEKVDHSGTLKFQCCIHPWMRLEASSR